MQTFEAIAARRSIRRFSSREIPREDIEQILTAAILAPSSKNAQPWKFIVVTPQERPAMLSAMKKGIENELAGNGLFPGSLAIPYAKHSMDIMAQAPVTVFVFNRLGSPLWDEQTAQARPLDLGDLVYMQSISAAIENMLLCATDKGIGSLWICDVFFAYREISQWLKESSPMVAAVSLGYPEENPAARSRIPLAEVVTWR